jgi:hypothetical protein
MSMAPITAMRLPVSMSAWLSQSLHPSLIKTSLTDSANCNVVVPVTPHFVLHRSLHITHILDLFLMHHCATPLHKAKTSYESTTYGQLTLEPANTRCRF